MAQSSSLPARVARLLGTFLAGVAVALFALVTGLLCFVLFPPADLLRQGALPMVRKAIGHQRLQIGRLELSPLSGLELQRIWLGAPDGFRQPLLTVRRVELRWDLRGLLDGELRVLKLLVERPLVRVEQRKGKLSWFAFLENMPGSSDKKKDEPKKPDKKSKPSDFKVWLDRVSIIGLGAAVDDGQRRLVLDSLHLALHGLWSEQQSDLHLALLTEGRTPGKANMIYQQQKPLAVGARLKTGLDLELRVKRLLEPRAQVKLVLDLASTRIQAPWKLDPLKLVLRLAAQGDLPGQQLDLQRLGLELNGSTLLRARGVVKQMLGSERTLKLAVQRLHLPLDKLAPYARALVKGIDFGGRLDVEQLQLAGSVASLSRGLPHMRGRVVARKVWASRETVAATKKGPGAASKGKRTRSDKLQIKDLNLRLDLATAPPGSKLAASYRQMLALLPGLKDLPVPGKPGAGNAEQGVGSGATTAILPVSARGWITLGSFSGMGASLRKLDLRLAAGARMNGFAPQQVAGKLTLRLPVASYRHRSMGRLAASLRAGLAAGGDLTSGELALDRLALSISQIIRLQASGKVGRWGRGQLAARLKLARVDLQRLWAWLPSPIRARMPTLRLRGGVALELNLAGKAPGPGTSPLRAPLRLDTRLALDGIHLADRKLKLAVRGLGGSIHVKGRPTDLRLETRLALARLDKTDQQLSVRGVRLPITARVTTRGVQATLGLTTRKLRKDDIQLASRGLHTELKLSAALPVHRLILGRRCRLGRTSVDLEAGFDNLQINAPNNRIAVARERTHIKLLHDPGKKGLTSVDLQTRISSFSHAQQGIDARGIRFSFKDRSTGLGPIVLPRPKLALRGLSDKHHLAINIQRARYRLQGLDVAGFSLDQRGAGRNFRLVQERTRDSTGKLVSKSKILLDGVDARVVIGVARLGKKGLLRRPLRQNRIELDVSASGLGPIPRSVTIRKALVRLPSRGLYVNLAGGVSGQVLPFSMTRLPTFDVTLEAGVKNGRATQKAAATYLWPGIHASGQAGVRLRLRRMASDRVRLDGKLLASAFHLWTETVKPERRLHIKQVDANVPISQELILKQRGFALPRPRSLISTREASVLYDSMRPYRQGGRARFSLGGLMLQEKVGKTRRELAIDRVSMDLAISQNALKLRRLYLKLFGGDIVGSVQAQVLSLAPLEPILLMRTQVTGVNLGYLDPEATSYSPKTEVSAMLDLDYRPRDEKLKGRVNITHLSLDMLDSLLAYIDPNKTNLSVQKNRAFINAWYIKWIDPKVKLVSIWISHGNLNMDIKLDAWFVVGTLLKRMVRNMRIRRVNVLPVLRQNVSPHLRKIQRGLDRTTGTKKSRRSRRSARR